jgi:hypothetical protein
MKTYTFALTDDEARELDANIDLLIYAYPDLMHETAVIAIMRMGSEEIMRRLKRMDSTRSAAHGNH